MKAIAIVTAIAGLLLPAWSAPEASPGNASAPGDQKPGVIVTVKRIESKEKTEDNAYGRRRYVSRETTTSEVALETEVRLMSRNPTTLQLEWFFVAKAVDGGKPWLCDKGEKTLELGPPVTTAKERLTSKKLQRSSWINVRGAHEEGSKIDGYIVQVKWQDKVLKAVASSRELEEIAASPEKLRQLLATREPGGSM